MSPGLMNFNQPKQIAVLSPEEVRTMRKRKAKDRQIAGYRIAGIGVDPGRQRLLVDDHEVKLEPKVMAVLVVLIRRFPVVVQRGELIAEVWEQTVVSDETVTMAVSKLRRALNDDPRAPRIIETIPKGGYRLMMEPEPLAARELAASSSAEAPRRPAKLALLALAACLIAMAGFALRSRPPAEVAPDLLESRPLTALPGREIHPGHVSRWPPRGLCTSAQRWVARSLSARHRG